MLILEVMNIPRVVLFTGCSLRNNSSSFLKETKSLMSSKTEAEQNKLKLPETKVESIMEDHVESNMVRNHTIHKEN